MLNRYQDILRAGKTPLIIDAGANIGFAAIVFREQFPAASIVSIEPNKENCDLARKNLEGLENLQILQKCLWHRETILAVENPGADAFSFRIEETAQREEAGVGSVTITISSTATQMPSYSSSRWTSRVPKTKYSVRLVIGGNQSRS